MGNKIITLTLNPVVDKKCNVPTFVPNQKIPCSPPLYYAGGGGINVSRALSNLGVNSTAIYLSGGRIGDHLNQLLNIERIRKYPIGLENNTRENLTVTDTYTQLQYRFGLPGPFVNTIEWKLVLDRIGAQLNEGDFLVASGKLPPGIPENFYYLVGKLVAEKKGKFILDTKGPALIHAIKAPILILKPNLAELAYLCKVDSISASTIEPLTRKLIKTYPIKKIVVSLGSKGALLVTPNLSKYIEAPVVPQASIIGAGDSMVAGMISSLMSDKTDIEMTQFGVACGSATTMRPSSQLCCKDDVTTIYRWMEKNTVTKEVY
ncbi:1-phosphofructokinase family hexose kinase [Maribacter sp. CXY002]|uniref:1-phosphofructokinase family hexose kinase n=1 Tax=Maribacter luteocoastalis TaxID=3407671 RepID=UPI003B6739C9